MDEKLDEAQIGSHSIDTSPVESIQSDEDGHIPFQIETEAVFKRLARDIYETDGAGIREPLTNAVTAILRAVNHDYLSEDDGVIEINVEEDAGGTTLTIRDNGIGMTMDKIRKIVSVIGASEARDIGELAGQFGMGFLAVFRLVGVNGGFEMSTNPRYTDDGPITGIWKSGGFTRDSDELLTDGLDEDEYGTRFSFILKESIGRHKVRDWVDNYSTWARVPVVYEEVIDGRVDYEENYGGFDLDFTDKYDDNKPYVEIENEYIYASTSDDAEGKTVLLDVPCDRSVSSRGDIRTILGNVDVRLKDENGVVLRGPNKGQMVVSDGEYNNMDESRKENFIKSSDLHSRDISLPQPTGTRRVLEDKPEFWSWVEKSLNDKISQRVESIMSEVDNYNELMSLDEQEFKLIMNCALQNVTRNYRSGFDRDSDGRDAKRWFDSNTNLNLSDDLAEKMAALVYNQRFADRDVDVVTKSRNLPKQTPAMAVYNAVNNDGDVYMGCRLTEDKVELVWEDSEDNYIFQIQSSDNYETYKELLNWKALRDISRKDVNEFDVSDETREEFFNVDDKSTNKSDYKLKFHYKSSTNRTNSVSVETLIDSLEDGNSVEISRTEVDNIILFPTHKDKNISDYYWMCNRHNPVSKCRKKDWERLKDYDMVKTADELIEKSKNINFKTSEGELSISEFDELYDSEDYSIMFHVVNENYKDCFASDKYIEIGEDFVNDKFANYKDIQYIYAPLTEREIRELHPTIDEFEVLRGDSSVKTIASTTSIRTDSKIYARIRLNEWKDSTEYESFVSSISRISINDGGYELIETLYKGFKDGGPVSQQL